VIVAACAAAQNRCVGEQSRPFLGASDGDTDPSWCPGLGLGSLAGPGGGAGRIRDRRPVANAGEVSAGCRCTAARHNDHLADCLGAFPYTEKCRSETPTSMMKNLPMAPAPMWADKSDATANWWPWRHQLPPCHSKAWPPQGGS